MYYYTTGWQFWRVQSCNCPNLGGHGTQSWKLYLWHRTANRNENHTVSIFVDVVSKLSNYIINNKYYFQIVTVLNFQQSIMNIINSPECHLNFRCLYLFICTCNLISLDITVNIIANYCYCLQASCTVIEKLTYPKVWHGSIFRWQFITYCFQLWSHILSVRFPRINLTDINGEELI